MVKSDFLIFPQIFYLNLHFTTSTYVRTCKTIPESDDRNWTNGCKFSVNFCSAHMTTFFATGTQQHPLHVSKPLISSCSTLFLSKKLGVSTISKLRAFRSSNFVLSSLNTLQLPLYCYISKQFWSTLVFEFWRYNHQSCWHCHTRRICTINLQIKAKAVLCT